MKTGFRNLIVVFWVTVVAFILSSTTLNKLLDISTYSGRSEPFSFSDFYVRTASHDVAQKSDDIFVVDVGNLSRAGIASLLDSLSSMGPKVIALDLFFRFAGQEGDESLTEAVRLAEDGIVLPRDVNRPDLVSFFYDEVNEARFGAVNQLAGTAHDVIRNFRPVFSSQDGPLDAFGLIIAEQLRPDLAAQVRQRGATSEFIRFDGVEFHTFKPEEILSGDPSIAGDIRGKAVFVGDMNDPQDQHLTPADPDMPGMMVHAKIAQTILSGQQIRLVPHWVVVLIAVLACSLYVWLLLFLRKKKFGREGCLIVRLIQFLLMYAFFLIGYWLYTGPGFLLDFSLPMLMMGLGVLSFDIIFGFYDLFSKAHRKK